MCLIVVNLSWRSKIMLHGWKFTAYILENAKGISVGCELSLGVGLNLVSFCCGLRIKWNSMHLYMKSSEFLLVIAYKIQHVSPFSLLKVVCSLAEGYVVHFHFWWDAMRIKLWFLSSYMRCTDAIPYRCVDYETCECAEQCIHYSLLW